MQFKWVKLAVFWVCLRSEFVSFSGSVYSAVLLYVDQRPQILSFGCTYALRNVINF